MTVNATEGQAKGFHGKMLAKEFKNPTITRTQAQRALDTGAGWPYDSPEGWRDENGDEPPPFSVDWAHAAARGVLADLNDRSGINRGFREVDAEVRAEIVASLSDIIREADRQRAT